MLKGGRNFGDVLAGNAFFIPEGTECYLANVARDGKPTGAGSFVEFTTTRDNLLSDADLLIDPVGTQGVYNRFLLAPASKVYAAELARAGYFGFRRHGYLLVIAKELVEIRW